MTAAPVLDHLAILADGIRTRIVAVLERQELTVTELCEVLQLPQSTVSRHLKVLADGDWVTSRRDGTSRLYAMLHDDLAPVARQLWLVIREQVASTAAADQDDRRLASVLAVRRSKSEAFFSTAAGQWDHLRRELFGSSSHLNAMLGLLDERWVVGDLGCGTGEVTATLAPFVARVIGIDASAEMLRAARERLAGQPNVEWRRGALEQLPLADAQLDVALLVLVLHHLADPGRVLAEARRVLKPGGRLLVADMLPHDHDEYRHTMGHVWLGFGEKPLARLVSAAGFDRLAWHPLAPDPAARGPALFVATAHA